MKKALINLINSIADRIKPCKHEWILISKKRVAYSFNKWNDWYEWVYMCKKCGKVNKIDNN
jgi:alpha-L-arabinofuranosidase